MRGNEHDKMATTQLYRCDLNTFSLHQQCCSSIEAVQLSGKIYIFQLHWGHIFGSNPGEFLLYAALTEPFSLHHTSLKEKCKEFQKYQKKHKMAPSLCILEEHCTLASFYMGSFYLFHFTVLNQSLWFCIDTITQNLITFCTCKIENKTSL